MDVLTEKPLWNVHIVLPVSTKEKINWYVYYHDSNSQKIVKWNVFNHGSFKEEVAKLLREKFNKEEFSEKLQKELMYYFWSKCEYEIILSPWTGQADDIKIDIYDQIMMNFDRFVDYVWSFRTIDE